MTTTTPWLERPESRPEYLVWLNMMARCYDPGHPQYADHGGRGVQVDPRWHSFDNFFEDMGPMPIAGTPHGGRKPPRGGKRSRPHVRKPPVKIGGA